MASSSFPLVLILSIALSMMLPATTQALVLAASNHASATSGGKIFDTQIGLSEALKIMESGTNFIWDAFRQPTSADRKNVQKITLIVESKDGVAYTSNDEIHLSADYVGKYSGDVKTEIKGVLYHELVHVWQWNGKGNAPGGLIEGIADYVRLTAGLAPSHWVKPGSGNKWDQGYDVTAYFLQYCDSVSSGFVAKLNAKLAGGWNLQFFNDLTGKSVDELWKNYKAKYGSSA